MNLSFDEASNRLNTTLWKTRNAHRRNKISPKRYEGPYGRKERFCPNGDQVRKYRNQLPRYILNDLNRKIFLAQIRYAQKHQLFGKYIDILVDNTDQWYYGNDRFPENPFITKGYNGPGTNRKQKYLALMIRSGPLTLFVGYFLIQKHHSNDPEILEVLDWLENEGISMRSVMGDRWFPTFGLLKGLRQRNFNYVAPYKKYAVIKQKLKDYLLHGGSYIFTPSQREFSRILWTTAPYPEMYYHKWPRKAVTGDSARFFIGKSHYERSASRIHGYRHYSPPSAKKETATILGDTNL